MKRIIALLMVFALCFGLAACGKNKEEPKNSTSVSVTEVSLYTEATEAEANSVISSDNIDTSTTEDTGPTYTLPEVSNVYKDTVSLSDIAHNTKKYQGTEVTVIFRVSQVSIDGTSYILGDALGENYMQQVTISFEYPYRDIHSMKDNELIKVKGVCYDGEIQMAEIIDRGDKLQSEYNSQKKLNAKEEMKYMQDISKASESDDDLALYKATVTIKDTDKHLLECNGKTYEYEASDLAQGYKFANGKTYHVCCGFVDNYNGYDTKKKYELVFIAFVNN